MKKFFDLKDKVATKIGEFGKATIIFVINGKYYEERHAVKEDEARKIVANAGGKLIAFNGHLVEDVNN